MSRTWVVLDPPVSPLSGETRVRHLRRDDDDHTTVCGCAIKRYAALGGLLREGHRYCKDCCARKTKMAARPYDVLNALPPEAFLNPADFVTEYPAEKDAAYLEKQRKYARGLSERAYTSAGCVFVAANGTWGAEGESWYVTTYEGIGYHAGTSVILEELLAGPAAFCVLREGQKSVCIKPAAKHWCRKCGEPECFYYGKDPATGAAK